MGRVDRRDGTSTHVAVSTGDAVLDDDLTIPAGARGLVLFAHGSGSSRQSPSNRRVAQLLNDAGCGTLLFGLDGDTKTLREVGAEFGISDERVRQLEQRALGKLHDNLVPDSRSRAPRLTGAPSTGPPAIESSTERPISLW